MNVDAAVNAVEERQERDLTHPCPECGKVCGSPAGLGIHRKHAHGVQSGSAKKAAKRPKAPERPSDPDGTPAQRALRAVLAESKAAQLDLLKQVRDALDALIAKNGA